MQIQINTDNTMTSHAPLIAHVESVVNETLHRFAERISRVEVHLSATNDHKQSGGEHACVMQARIEGHPPLTASEHASSLHRAIHGAADKLKRAIDSTFGRLNDGVKGDDPASDPEPESVST